MRVTRLQDERLQKLEKRNNAVGQKNTGYRRPHTLLSLTNRESPLWDRCTAYISFYLS